MTDHENDVSRDIESTVGNHNVDPASHGSPTWKVLGAIDAPDGTGVLGHNTATSGAAFGVKGVSDADGDPTATPSLKTAGVYGTATGASVTHGVFGEATDGNSRGVVGTNLTGGYDTQEGYPAGVSGYTDRSGADTGVNIAAGTAGGTFATSGQSYGVNGFSHSPDGAGVRGLDLDGGGYGLATPDDAKVGGTTVADTIDTPGGNPLTLHTDAGTIAFRLGVPGTDTDGNTAGANVVGGHPDNSANDGVGVTVSGGGSVGTEIVGTADRANSNEAFGNYGTIAGGQNNRVGLADGTATTGTHATVGGGSINTASGGWATVPGGNRNEASGTYSFAAGQRSKAVNDNAFVWNDGSEYNDGSDVNGILHFYSSKDVAGSGVTGSRTFNVSAANGVRFVTSGSTVTYIPAGSSGWSTSSSREVKTNISPIDPESVLAGVGEMDISTWEYEADGDGTGVTHIGPMAEDFHEAVGVDIGDSDDHINTINAIGVAFGAIKGLTDRLRETREQLSVTNDQNDGLESEIDRKNEQIDDLRRENSDLRDENDALRERLDSIENRLRAVEESRDASAPADD